MASTAQKKNNGKKVQRASAAGKKSATSSKASKKAASPKKAEKFAVIQSGGKQYLVKSGDVVQVEKIKSQPKDGKISFTDVLLVFDEKEVKIGNPYVKGAKVEAEIIENLRGKKINVIRYKSKTRQFKKKGHRQHYTKIKITKI